MAAGLAVGFAASWLSYVQGADLSRATVHGLVAMGVRGERNLTNLLFWAGHPEVALRKLQPGEREHAAEWMRIRNDLVRPALQAATTGGVGASSGTSAGAASDGGRSSVAGDAIGVDRLGVYGDEEATAFRREVFSQQLARNQAMGKEFFPGLQGQALAPVEGGHKLHVVAAGDGRDLLSAARADLAADRAAGKADALEVASIGIGSAYRDPERDLGAWKKAFNTHYNNTANIRENLKGGAHGSLAVSLLVTRMVEKKALPGYSNHTRGLAIDFTTRQGKWTFGASSAQKQGWVKTWLYKWLEAKAAKHNFKPYPKEPWHWDHST